MQATLQELELHCSRVLPSPQTPHSSVLKVPRFLEPKYENIFEQYISANMPCVVAAATAGWPCSEHWVREGEINVDFLTKQYGELLAPVADCENLKYDSQCKEEKTVREYMLYLSRMTGECTTGNSPNLYLKDWHLQRERPHDTFYRVPKCFASDWLNEYALDRKEDDFMFVYIGPKGSWTPLHVDVYSSFSWSANVVGRKRWLLLPPGEEDKLRDSFGRLPSHVPLTPAADLRIIELLQEAGDAVFVPSGWHHQVTNELDTISINHNWINGCNIGKVWMALNGNLKLVEKEIEDLRQADDFSEKCQIILKSLFGMHYKNFVEFLLHIARERLAQWYGETKVLFGGYTLGRQHVKFDLSSIIKILDAMLKDDVFLNKLNEPHLKIMMSQFKVDIESIMKIT